MARIYLAREKKKTLLHEEDVLLAIASRDGDERSPLEEEEEEIRTNSDESRENSRAKMNDIFDEMGEDSS